MAQDRFRVGCFKGEKEKSADSEQPVPCEGFPAAVSLELGDGATDDLGLVPRLSEGAKRGQTGATRGQAEFRGESKGEKISASVPKQGKRAVSAALPTYQLGQGVSRARAKACEPRYSGPVRIPACVRQAT